MIVRSYNIFCFCFWAWRMEKAPSSELCSMEQNPIQILSLIQSQKKWLQETRNFEYHWLKNLIISTSISAPANGPFLVNSLQSRINFKWLQSDGCRRHFSWCWVLSTSPWEAGCHVLQAQHFGPGLCFLMELLLYSKDHFSSRRFLFFHRPAGHWQALGGVGMKRKTGFSWVEILIVMFSPCIYVVYNYLAILKSHDTEAVLSNLQCWV